MKYDNQFFLYSAISDLGVERATNEDFVQIAELDDDSLIAIIADGSGSYGNNLQPASIVCVDILDTLQEEFEMDRDLFFSNIEFFLKQAFSSANKLLGAFKMGNEELYAGYATSATCVVCDKSSGIALAHTGNTRAYLIRGGNLIQLTRDYTRAQDLLEEGEISQEDYYARPELAQMTSGIGIVAEPTIDVFSGKFKENDIILMTSDGVHNAIRSDVIPTLVLESENADNACQVLIEGAKSVKYVDNMSAIIITPGITG